MPGDFAPFEAKMRADGLGDAAVAAFKNSYEALVSGATGMIPESDLRPAAGVPKLADVATGAKPDAALLAKTLDEKILTTADRSLLELMVSKRERNKLLDRVSAVFDGTRSAHIQRTRSFCGRESEQKDRKSVV